MKTQMASTSIEAYNSIKDKLNQKQQIVLDVIRQHPGIWNRRIAQNLDWDINRVTGRVNELAGMNKIQACGKIRDPETNRTVYTWLATDNAKGQLNIF